MIGEVNHRTENLIDIFVVMTNDARWNMTEQNQS